MKSLLLRVSPAILAALVVAACGGGASGPQTTPLSGTAATGAPVASGQVSVSCGKAAAVTTATAADGTWHVDVPNPVFPCIVSVSGGSLGSGVTLFGYATAATNVNVTPLTTLIGAYATKAANGGTVTQAMLDAAVTKVSDVLVAAGFAPLPANPLTVTFKPVNGDPVDDYLEVVMGALASQNVTLGTLVEQIATTGAPAAPLKGPDVVGFNSIPAQFPFNTVSFGFEAEGFSSMGERLTLAPGSARILRGVDVVMSSWACQSGAWFTHDCVSAADATFVHSVTLRVWDGNDNLIATRTQDFALPYRPSSDPSCADGKWKAADGACYNGKASLIAFDLRSLNLTLTDNFSFDLQYNTRDQGPHPIGGAFGPWDSLNVGAYNASTTSPSVGTDRNVGAFLRNGSLYTEAPGYGVMMQVILGAN